MDLQANHAKPFYVQHRMHVGVCVRSLFVFQQCQRRWRTTASLDGYVGYQNFFRAGESLPSQLNCEPEG